MNGNYYANVLKTYLHGARRKKRPDLLKKQWFLLQDSARPHIAAVALAALTERGVRVCVRARARGHVRARMRVVFFS